ncbi:MAG: 50S ribosomal protein L24 [Candidatus Glassbacteria bacterium RBG_16_58_8]|uniref:Large ribosomal subunit protein uL24 n=1 Tax=Candidatus Glassbacteria bacterium RBG_16_58_8 TaxID=1817866 RepID=A0A1F5YAL5_9BACT|nr:ribosomal protein L24 [uncultured bacterium]OGF97052.1 MAG: 50S ribosomal protein L24 [Candidatus Glassbacteria bacterium RBG_16_58_8]
MNITKNDIVLVISGDDRGKTGKVLRIFQERNRITVENVNFVKRHSRPTTTNPQGGIVQREAPIPISNVMLYCSKCNRGTRVRRKILADERRTKARICARCGEIISRSVEEK